MNVHQIALDAFNACADSERIELLDINRFHALDTDIAKLRAAKLHPSIVDIFEHNGAYLLQWISPKDSSVGGNMALSAAADLIATNHDLGNDFHVFDRGIDEVTVGFYGSGDQIHYRDVSDDPTGDTHLFGLSALAYFELGCLCRGFYYWQFALVQLEKNKPGAEARAMTKHLPKLFPEVDIARIVNRYQELKSDKPTPRRARRGN